MEARRLLPAGLSEAELGQVIVCLQGTGVSPSRWLL